MIWREEPRGRAAPAELLSLGGLERIQALMDGRAAEPPIHHLTGMRPTSVGPSTSVFQMPATPWLLSSAGFIMGGTLAMLADGPLGSAIQTLLAPGEVLTTAELSMSYLRPAVADGGTLTARGRVVHAGRSLALSEATISDAAGRDLAHCTSRCFLFSVGAVPDEPPPLPPVERSRYTTPDPYERPVEGEPTAAEVWLERDGLAIVRAWIEGTLPRPPIHILTGQRPTAAQEGSCEFTMPATGWLCSPSGLLEGGTLVMLADAALATAAMTTVPAGTAFAPTDITVKFIRPVPPDQQELTARARVVHRGRTIAVSEAQILNAAGKLVCTATGSAMILPGRDMTAPIAPQEEPHG